MVGTQRYPVAPEESMPSHDPGRSAEKEKLLALHRA